MKESDHREFYQAVLSLQDEQTCAAFFQDLCTYKELDQMSQRIVAAKLLLAGETYEKVVAETNISTATLSRVSRCCKYGNGYKNVLK